MLKLACHAEERAGAAIMQHWAGAGAAAVLQQAGDALLLERATGPLSLAVMAASGPAGDSAATRILVDTAAALHRPRPGPLPATVPLPQRFRALATAAAAQGGLFAQAHRVAEGLLAAPLPPVLLHGDLHHDNVLDFGASGWKAIDPKGLWGERGFDFANLFCNPAAAPATDAASFDRRLAAVVAFGGVEAQRQRDWVLAYCGLSAAWSLEDGQSPAVALAVAACAAEGS